MSDAVLLALIAGIVSTVATLVAAIAGLIIAMKTNKKQEEVVKKQDEAAIKTAEIHTATNGALSELREINKVAMQEIKGLKDLIAEKDLVKKEVQAVVAAQAAQAAPLQVTPKADQSNETKKAHLEIAATIVGPAVSIEDIAGTIKPKGEHK